MNLSTSSRKNLYSFLALCFFVALGVGSTPDTKTGSPSTTSSSGSFGSGESGSEDPKTVALRDVKLDFKWSKEGFGNIMTADFTITNPTNYRLKDFEVECDHSAPSGTVIDSNTRTIYEIVEPKSKKVIKDFNMGFIHSQAKSSSCRITDLTVVQ